MNFKGEKKNSAIFETMNEKYEQNMNKPKKQQNYFKFQ